MSVDRIRPIWRIYLLVCFSITFLGLFAGGSPTFALDIVWSSLNREAIWYTLPHPVQPKPFGILQFLFVSVCIVLAPGLLIAILTTIVLAIPLGITFLLGSIVVQVGSNNIGIAIFLVGIILTIVGLVLYHNFDPIARAWAWISIGWNVLMLNQGHQPQALVARTRGGNLMADDPSRDDKSPALVNPTGFSGVVNVVKQGIGARWQSKAYDEIATMLSRRNAVKQELLASDVLDTENLNAGTKRKITTNKYDKEHVDSEEALEEAQAQHARNKAKRADPAGDLFEKEFKPTYSIQPRAEHFKRVSQVEADMEAAEHLQQLLKKVEDGSHSEEHKQRFRQRIENELKQLYEGSRSAAEKQEF